MFSNYPFNFSCNTQSDSNPNRERSNVALSSDSITISGVADFGCRSDPCGHGVVRPSSGSQNESFGQAQWSWQQSLEEPTSIRRVQNGARSPQAACIPAQSHPSRSCVEHSSTIQLPQRRQFAALTLFRQPSHCQLPQTAPTPPAVINRQTEHGYAGMFCAKGNISEWLPIDLLHVQPLQETLTIEDMVRYELAVAGTFEMRGRDMEALYTLAGL